MKTLITLLLLGSALGVMAEVPDTDSAYFHPAASMYIHGESSGASNLVAQGLSLFPDDGKLLRLKELLDQQQEQQQNQDNEDQQDDQNKDQNQEQEQDPQQNDPQQNPEDQQDQQQEPQDQEEPQEPEPPSAEQMSQDEAERLLDAMKQEEETKRLQLHPVMGAPVKVDKDW